MPLARWNTLWTQARAAVLGSNMLWYGLTASLVSGVPILLLPFLLSRLPTAQYAHIVSMQIIVMFGGLLINLGLDGSVARDALRTRPRHLASHVTLALGTQLAMFILLSGLGLHFARDLERWIEYPASRFHLTLLGCFLQQVTFFTANLMRLLGRVRVYAALSICQAALEIGLSLGLLYTVIPNWEARLWGLLAASAVTGAGAAGLLWRQDLIKPPRYGLRVLGRMLNFGLPTLPHTLFSLLSAWADRFLLIHLCGAATAGIYAAAAQSIMVINFVGSVVNLAWTPWLYRQLSSRSTLAAMQPQISRVAFQLAGLLMLAGLALEAAMAGYFRWIAPPAYREAITLLPWLALGTTANALYKVATNFLFFHGKTRYLAGVALAILVISLVSQFALVPLYQGMASAVVFAVINLIQMACAWFMAGRVFPLGPPLTAFRR